MAKPCELCHKNIRFPSKVVSYINKTWHTDCFNCSLCTRRLTVATVHSVGDRIYCRHCFGSQAQNELVRAPSKLDNTAKPPPTPEPTKPPKGAEASPVRKADERPTKTATTPRASSLNGETCCAPPRPTGVPTSQQRERSQSTSNLIPAPPEAPKVRDAAPSSIRNPQTSKKLPMTVVRGSICDQKVDVIVNSIGSHHDLSRGALSRALLDRTGPDLQDDLYKEATRDPKARVYVTKGHGLPCNYVFHAICGGYSDSKESNQNFCSLVDEILTKADSLKTRSIAIPPIGTGNLGYPASFVAKMIVKSIDDYASSYPETNLVDFRFVLLETDKALIKEFEVVTRQRDQQPLLETDQDLASEIELREQQMKNMTLQRHKSPTVYPSTWVISQTDKTHGRYALNPESSEYKRVVQNMTDRGGKLYVNRICKITRVENKFLHEMYEASKKTLEKQCQAETVERILWHGTSNGVVDGICHYGFNRSYCGKNGVLYGQGVYYARDFSYSANDTYSPADDYSKWKCVMQCRVLTGTFTTGNKDMIEPPEISPGKRYDSTVDDENDPTIFVIFYDFRMYPEYVISFCNEAINY